MDKLPVTILIPVKNEEANLPRCLASVTWASEVIVIDSHSTDATASICESAGARVVQFSYQPPWPKKKQWALENLAVKNEWVFLLDADEVLPTNTVEILRPIVTRSDKNSPDGYWVDRRFFFLGQPLRHAYTPNWNLRLFRRGTCHFERLSAAETHSGDNEVHEHLLCSGRTVKLPQLVMDHYAFPTIEIFMEKHLRYAAWEAAVELHPQPSPATHGKLSPAVAFRRALKNFSRHLPFRPTLRFLWIYIFQKAFLDGPAGYAFARCHALYEELIALKKAELSLRR